jgi:DNA polymerase-3 subunit delta
MKISAGKLAGFLRRPDPSLRAVLVYGPDRGMVREHASTLLTAAGGDPADPFAHVELTAENLKRDPARLADEAASLTFSGRRRTVRLRDAGDDVAAPLEAWLESGGGGGFVVIEGGDLGKRSSLRRLVEDSPVAAAVPCYPDEPTDLGVLVRDTLAGGGLAIDDDAAARLTELLAGDRAAIRGELEKLAVYAGETKVVTIDDVAACIGDGAAASIDAIADAACGGQPGTLLAALDRAFAEGISAVLIVRGTARHVQRLWTVAARIADGEPTDKAMTALRPPVFFKSRESFRRQVRAWTPDRLGLALDILTEAEIDCKSSATPADLMCERALLRIARAAGAARP